MRVSKRVRSDVAAVDAATRYLTLATDRYVLRDGRWLCTYRRFEHLFEGDTPVTNPNLDDDK